MQRLNTAYFYEFGWRVHQLLEIKETSKRRDVLWGLYLIRNHLKIFVDNALIPAPLSKTAATNLIAAIDVTAPQKNPSPDYMEEGIGPPAWDINQKLSEFEHVLAAELQQISTFVTAQKGIFDTGRLVEDAEYMFSEEVRVWLSEQAIVDIRQAGRCLAFELSTAAGFHLARAVEDAIRKYYETIAGTPYDIINQGRSWAKYISSLKSKGADDKVLSALDQMRDLHRNPISHPDINLETDDAMMLVGIAQSAIVAMAIDSQARNPVLSLPLEGDNEKHKSQDDGNGIREDREETHLDTTTTEEGSEES